MNYGTALILSVDKRSYYLINNETVRTYSPQQTAYIMENSSKMSATNAPDIPAFVQTFFFISHPFYKFQLWTLETAKNLILKISRLFSEIISVLGALSVGYRRLIANQKCYGNNEKK